MQYYRLYKIIYFFKRFLFLRDSCKILADWLPFPAVAGQIHQREQEIAELKQKIAEVMAVMPSLSYSSDGSNLSPVTPHYSSKFMDNSPSSLDPNASVYQPLKKWLWHPTVVRHKHCLFLLQVLLWAFFFFFFYFGWFLLSKVPHSTTHNPYMKRVRLWFAFDSEIFFFFFTWRLIVLGFFLSSFGLSAGLDCARRQWEEPSLQFFSLFFSLSWCLSPPSPTIFNSTVKVVFFFVFFCCCCCCRFCATLALADNLSSGFASKGSIVKLAIQAEIHECKTIHVF